MYNKDKTMQEQGLLIDLDSLMDTRLGTILKTFPDTELSTDFLETHVTRVEDKWDTLDNGLIEREYGSRNREVLRGSVGTKALKWIDEYVKVSFINNMNLPDKTDIRIYLNVWPYLLGSEEENIFKRVISHHTNNMVDVVVINKPYRDISVAWVDEHISMMMLYRFDLWLYDEVIVSQLVKHPLPEVGLLTPRIKHFGSADITKEQEQLRDKHKVDIFAFIEQSMLETINLKFMDADLFSVAL